MLAPASRRPGIVYAPAPPPLDDVLPRMDIAGFVGFAERGPLDVPVAVEDDAQFAAVFGAAPELAWDAARGEPVRAHLAGAVNAFFAAGGRRCWVVRVAGDARTERFAVPGLARVRPLADRPHRMRSAIVAAASPGSWADDLAIGASLTAGTLPATAIRKAIGGLQLDVEGAGETLVPGDLLRVTFAAVGRILHAVVTRPGASVNVRVGAWLALVEPDPGTLGEARWANAEGRLVRAPARLDPGLTLTLSTAVADAPPHGTLVRVRLPGRRIVWLAAREALDAGRDGVVVTAAAAWRLAGGQALPEFDPRRDAVERLELDLAVREAGGEATVASGLGLAVEHPRYACALPGFVLAADEPPAEQELLVPFAVEAVPALWAGPMRAPGPVPSALARDGLADLGAVAFTDPRLDGVGVHALREQAAALGTPTRGLHALLELDEVTLVAAPDAVQPGWSQSVPPGLPPSDPPAGRGPGERTTFRLCAATVLHAPALVRRASAPDAVALAWDTPTPGVTFRLERAARTDWSDATSVFSGPERELTLRGLPAGPHRFRVRAEDAEAVGPWSTGIDVLVAAPSSWIAGAGPVVHPSVHRSLATLAAARGDVLALLSLPRDAETEAAARYVEALLDDRTRSYAAAYHPWTVGARPLPPDGAAAGLLAARALGGGSWRAPANQPVPGALALSPLLTAEEEDRLRVARVNVVTPTPAGPAWLSTDTLSADFELGDIGVRRLLALLRRAALRYGPVATFEPLDDVLLRSVRRDFEGLLGRLHRLGALEGASAQEAYRVEVAAQAEDQLVVALKVAPSRPLLFLTVRLVVAGGRGTVSEAA